MVCAKGVVGYSHIRKSFVPKEPVSRIGMLLYAQISDKIGLIVCLRVGRRVEASAKAALSSFWLWRRTGGFQGWARDLVT
jgi:hypothetical protein